MLLAALAAAVAMGGAPQATSVADPHLTPGKVRSELTIAQICATRWGEDHRAVTAAMKRQVYQRYGFAGPKDPRCTPDRTGRTCEVDHRVPRCVGGADDLANLSPQPYGGAWNAHMKDRVEDQACRAVCALVKPMPLKEAQAAFLGDWTLTYRAWFGTPLSVPAP